MDAAPSLSPIFNSANLHSGFSFWACFVRPTVSDSPCTSSVVNYYSNLSPLPTRFPTHYLEAPQSPRMQNMQRRFGRMTTKQSADDSQIAVLLKDFDDADMLLGKVGIHISRTRVRISNTHYFIRSWILPKPGVMLG